MREFDLLFVIRVRDGFTSSCLCQPALPFYSVTSGTESEGPSSTRTSALAMSPHSSSLDDRQRLGALGIAIKGRSFTRSNQECRRHATAKRSFGLPELAGNE